ncbi:uncharacterized protein LOC127803819 isoform X2 [Diospyros lotus]|uniref:uncharacterized protein LOC127803819 isoform X2 n=1 Tax=Diospyros lotus TaxID=55363 RepID=UPI00225285C7|nr:uncharacterized protein LOC127803819 isoform X2 [Diospyros lotus]XP_052196313.1 uncharacterized protein LOC127803819 isoform X2 [Diospyros lotus]XP_052196314.1 uncharacterized protein LOC127803819 isoform X2 [Diospyros lotus]XP_052196315.1 uncharacterized protein LOC127803819 isoform X2 [Diospyros lotus]
MESQSHSKVSGAKMMLSPPTGTFQDREDLIRHVRDFGANQGYVVTIKKSRKNRRVILGCDRGGIYRNRRKIEECKRKRKVHSRLINCPFEAVGKKEEDVWVLTIKNGEHNHEPLRDISEHPYSRRFTEEEVRKIKLMTEAGAKPRQVLKALKQTNPELQSTPRHLYNLKAKFRQGNLSEKSFKSWRPNRSVQVNTSVEAPAKHKCPVKVPNFIGGKFMDSQACAIVDVVNPATQEVVSQVPCTTYEEFKVAVHAAKEAFPSWKNIPISTRQRIMFKFQELIRRDIDKLAMNIATEQGKPLNGAKGDVLLGLEVLEHACGMTNLQMGEFVPNASNGIDTYCIREPVGVCAGICPFNFPAMISLWMFPIAVTCGNTFILKPSDKNPGASMILAALAKEAGLPDGVLNVVHGSSDIVNHICDDDDIKAISFVGSNTAGMQLYARAAVRGKRIQTNMGAKNHAIIMPDASADAALDALVAAGFIASGQWSMALSTAIFVGGSMLWEEELAERAKALKVNVGTEAGADIGPVITKEAKDRICRVVQSGVECGARLILDGRNIVVPGYEHGNFVGPTILCDVTTSMECYKEDIFGPVLLCMQADSLEDAIAIVNRSKCGNGVALFTTSGIAARTFESEIEAGLVGINVPVPIPLPFSSFNGSEASCAGKAGVQLYTQIKTVAQRWRDLPSRRVSQPLPVTSETEITSRGASLVQPPTSESDLPSQEVSPAMPSAPEGDLSDHNASLPLTPTSERDLPNPDPLPSIPPTMDRNLRTQAASQTIPGTSDIDSTNQEISLPVHPATERRLPGTGMSLSVPQTSDRLYIPQASHWGENVPLCSERIYIPPASQRSDEMVATCQRKDVATSTSERVYLPTSHIHDIMASGSHRNDSVGPLSHRTDPNMHPTSERLYISTVSHRSTESVGSCQRTDTMMYKKSERVYMPTSHQSDSLGGLMSLRTDTTLLPVSQRIYINSTSYRNQNVIPSQSCESMISSQRTDTIAATSGKAYSAMQANDAMPSTSEGLYLPGTHQRIYTPHQLLLLDEFPGQGVSLNMPTSQRL